MRSHPAWVCGLKLEVLILLLVLLLVTPCVGVWIETTKGKPTSSEVSVTPCVGVWIETYETLHFYAVGEVTPCVGVWIETVMYDESPDGDLSHTLRGCVD